jgi:hypothetical protein
MGSGEAKEGGGMVQELKSCKIQELKSSKVKEFKSLRVQVGEQSWAWRVSAGRAEFTAETQRAQRRDANREVGVPGECQLPGHCGGRVVEEEESWAT